MKKLLCIMLAALVLIPSMLFVSSAAGYKTSDAKSTPTIDGSIGSSEYSGALVVEAKTANQTYYNLTESLGVWTKHTSKDVASRGDGKSSHMIGNSKIYMVANADGFYFAFDIKDTTIGCNYIRDEVYRGGMFHGDAVHVLFRTDNDVNTNDKMFSGDSLRISVAPFATNKNGNNNISENGGKRVPNILAAFTTDARTQRESNNQPMIPAKSWKADVTPIVIGNGKNKTDFYAVVKTDSSGYVLEFFLPWSVIDENTSFAQSSFTAGKKLYISYMITDAMGRNPQSNSGDGCDWAIFHCPINAKFKETKTGLVCDSVGTTKGFLIEGGANYVGFDKDTGAEITLSKSSGSSTSETQKETQKKTETQKSSETQKKTETQKVTSKVTDTDLISDTDLETETIDSESVSETSDGSGTETETETDTGTETEKETESESEAGRTNPEEPSGGLPVPAIIGIIAGGVAVVAAVVVIIIKKKAK